jgi:hypothetical protein
MFWDEVFKYKSWRSQKTNSPTPVMFEKFLSYPLTQHMESTI